jgi:hypothetical protein
MKRGLSANLSANLTILSAFAALSACSHTGGVKVERVEVPTPVPCLRTEDIPPEPLHVADKLTGQAAHDLVIVAESALELRIWGRSMRAALEACAE